MFSTTATTDDDPCKGPSSGSYEENVMIGRDTLSTCLALDKVGGMTLSKVGATTLNKVGGMTLVNVGAMTTLSMSSLDANRTM